MVAHNDEGTLVRHDDEDDGGTMIQHATLTSEQNKIESAMGTMVINDEEEEDDDTMKQHDTTDYRPAFLDHFEKKDKDSKETPQQSPSQPSAPQPQVSSQNVQNPQLQKQLEQIAGKGISNSTGSFVEGNANEAEKMANYHKSLLEGDLDFLKYLSFEELKDRMANIDTDMEREIDDLRRRYHAKRQPILDAMDQKRKRQQNF